STWQSDHSSSISINPGNHFVAIKTVEQQDMKALRSTRQLMVEQRTALANFRGIGNTYPYVLHLLHI
ncbi:hypothetical protein FTO51_24085, partial [Salmonella enterica subsp. enterica serovar Kentucky]|nr:hypothetical protein [Salmonella enterica subsp. enterica serovar Kentucky]ECV0787382.1 hypothetical protein [Salmonella enterica subsp. enterica serovar Kentucky]